MKKLTTKEFIEKSKSIHGDRYDYSLVNYINNSTKISLVCKIHGVFTQRPINHMNGQGCPSCYGNKNKTTKKFIEESKKIHGDKYDYSLVDYKNNRTDVTIICPEHGEFKQKPPVHLNGFNCMLCRSDSNTLTIDDFIIRVKKIHGDKYDYSLVKYINSHIKVKITCPEHGIFEQRPNDHISGYGCPSCKESKGEMGIRMLLEEKNILFEIQKTFDGCKYKSKLRFDFYLPDYNTCIEFDGEQHFRPINFFGGEEGFEGIQKRDMIKTKYCEDNSIKLIRISNKETIINELDFLY